MCTTAAFKEIPGGAAMLIMLLWGLETYEWWQRCVLPNLCFVWLLKGSCWGHRATKPRGFVRRKEPVAPGHPQGDTERLMVISEFIVPLTVRRMGRFGLIFLLQRFPEPWIPCVLCTKWVERGLVRNMSRGRQNGWKQGMLSSSAPPPHLPQPRILLL